MIFFSTILLLFLNIIIWEINVYNQKKNQELMELQLLLQKESDTTEYYKNLIQQNENQNHLIHDIKKHLQSIALLNEQNEREKIAAYISHVVSSSDLQTSSHICGNEFLNAILNRYRHKCLDTSISFRADIRNHAVDFLKENDMTCLFCNLLDNAVEAAINVPDAFIELSASHREHTAFTVITMTNSCRKNPFAANHKLPTTKPDKLRHGYGMKIIERVIKNYQGEMEVYYSEDTRIFHTIITLK